MGAADDLEAVVEALVAEQVDDVDGVGEVGRGGRPTSGS